jgi:replicative DNA helicase
MADVPQLPCDPTAEAAAVSDCILDPSAVSGILGLLDAGMFHSLGFRRMFAAVSDLHAKGARIDQITVVDAMDGDRGENQLAVLDACLKNPGSLFWREHAEVVRRLAERRSLIRTADYIARIAANGEDGAAALAEDAVRKAAMPSGQAAWVSASEAFLSALDADKGGKDTISTGYPDIDRILGGGMGAGHLVILAARPSIGKSALALNIGVKAARAGVTVAFISLEMTSESLALRCMSSLSGTPLQDLRSGSNNDPSALHRAMSTMADAPLHICNLPTMTVPQIQSAVSRLFEGCEKKLVVIDYLQLITPSGKKSESRQVEVATMSRSLKLLSVELNCPILLLAQLNRAVESRANKRPQLSDLRESGAIEQDADVVMFLDRSTTPDEAKPENRTRPNEGEAVLAIAKNRHGETGDVWLRWDAPRVRFFGMSQRRDAS